MGAEKLGAAGGGSGRGRVSQTPRRGDRQGALQTMRGKPCSSPLVPAPTFSSTTLLLLQIYFYSLFVFFLSETFLSPQ